ncbi:hypothetical protein F4703DRAFT_1185593 [Phycomyces blakesleeanus]
MQMNESLQNTIKVMKKARSNAKYEVVFSYYVSMWYKNCAQSSESFSRAILGFFLALARESRVMRSLQSTLGSPIRTPNSDQPIQPHNTLDITE